MSAKLSSLDPVLFNSVVVAVAVAVAVALISESNSVTDSVDAKQRRRETMTNSVRNILIAKIVYQNAAFSSSSRFVLSRTNERTKERKICLLFLFFHLMVSVRMIVAGSSCGVMSVRWWWLLVMKFCPHYARDSARVVVGGSELATLLFSLQPTWPENGPIYWGGLRFAITP